MKLTSVLLLAPANDSNLKYHPMMLSTSLNPFTLCAIYHRVIPIELRHPSSVFSQSNYTHSTRPSHSHPYEEGNCIATRTIRMKNDVTFIAYLTFSYELAVVPPSRPPPPLTGIPTSTHSQNGIYTYFIFQ